MRAAGLLCLSAGLLVLLLLLLSHYLLQPAPPARPALHPDLQADPLYQHFALLERHRARDTSTLQARLDLLTEVCEKYRLSALCCKVPVGVM